jgi:hypothetical protein
MKKKKILGLAVAAVLGMAATAQTASAANLANDGVGEIAYIPYYSTLDGKQSYVRLVNNGFDTLIVKLKIRDGVQSVDARDFYIFLSPRDVWTARVFNDGAGLRLATTDTSCTVPSKRNVGGGEQWRLDKDAAGNGIGWSINIPNVDGRLASEGYIVAQVAGTSGTAAFNPFDEVFDTNTMVKHIGNDPRNCPEVSTAFDFIKGSNLELANPDKFDILRSQFTEPTNALSAAAAIVNPINATLTDLPVTVVANVYNPGATGVDNTSDYAEANRAAKPNDTIDIVAGDFPDELDVTPAIATIFDDSSAVAITLALPIAEQVVSAALMHSSVMNNLDTTGAGSWVVTFPTKKHHFGAPCSAPFPADCQPNITPLQHVVRDAGAVSYVTNEEESEFINPVLNEFCFSGVDLFDPDRCPVKGGDGQVSLPNEVNVVTFKGGNPLKSALVTDIPAQYLGDIVYGWMQMRFTDAQTITDGVTTLYGLPVIGFGYTEYALGGVATMSQAHSYTSPGRP